MYSMWLESVPIAVYSAATHMRQCVSLLMCFMRNTSAYRHCIVHAHTHTTHTPHTHTHTTRAHTNTHTHTYTHTRVCEAVQIEMV